MYLRTTRRRNADGSVVRCHQLAENVWDPAKGCAVAKVVYNFGRADVLDRTVLERLARSITRVVAEGATASGDAAIDPDLRLINSWPYGGLDVLSWVFSGHITDVTTVEQVKADLRGWRLNRCVFVGDAGRRQPAAAAGDPAAAQAAPGGDGPHRLVTRPLLRKSP